MPASAGLLYEVLRIIKGRPLFFLEHYARFLHTAQSKEVKEFPSYHEWKAMVDDFIKALGKEDFNIKSTFDPTTREMVLFENPSSYPPASLYEIGIKTVTMTYRRQDPNSKIVNQQLTSLATKIRQETKSYEVLLLNEDGCLTEGSRSNIFFFRDNSLYTPPLNQVLPGVTRKKIMEMCHDKNIVVEETAIYCDDFHTYEGAFMSGTSPKILPIASIDDLRLESARSSFLKELRKSFDDLINRDLEAYSLAK